MANSTRERNLAVAAFRARMEAAFQTGSLLSDKVEWVSGVEAESYRFPVDGIAETVRKLSGADVTPVEVENAKPTAFLESEYSVSYLDPQDTRLSNVDFMRSRADKHAKAMKRAWDGAIITALNTWDDNAYIRPGLTNGAASHNFETANTGRKIAAADLAKVRATLMDEGLAADADDICFVYPALQF